MTTYPPHLRLHIEHLYYIPTLMCETQSTHRV